METKAVQINILTTSDKKEKLQKIARLRSIENNKDTTYIDLIREKIDEIIAESGSMDYNYKNCVG